MHVIFLFCDRAIRAKQCVNKEQEGLRSLKNGVVVSREDNLGNVLFGETDLVLMDMHSISSLHVLKSLHTHKSVDKYFRFSPRRQLQGMINDLKGALNTAWLLVAYSIINGLTSSDMELPVTWKKYLPPMKPAPES